MENNSTKLLNPKTFWSVAINFYKSIELINERKTENPVIHLRKSGNRSFSIKCFTPKKSNRRRNILEFESQTINVRDLSFQKHMNIF